MIYAFHGKQNLRICVLISIRCPLFFPFLFCSPLNMVCCQAGTVEVSYFVVGSNFLFLYLILNRSFFFYADYFFFAVVVVPVRFCLNAITFVNNFPLTGHKKTELFFAPGMALAISQRIGW